MHISEILVVYFAYGVPFGVYGVARVGRQLRFADLLRFVFWPVVLAAWIRGYFSGSATFHQTDIDAGLAEIRMSLESTAFHDRTASEILEFRSIFYTYASLSMQCSSAAKNRQTIPGVAGSAVSRSASACKARSNRMRTEFHRDRAGQDLRSLVDGIPATYPKYGTIVAKCVKLALLVDDPELALQFSRLQPAVTDGQSFEPVSVP
jgi:hypothetical protein